MSLNIYLDDCAYAKELARQLEAAGHTVVIPAAIGTTGVDDSVHFKCACSNGWVILTKNPNDFETLCRGEPAHAGCSAFARITIRNAT